MRAALVLNGLNKKSHLTKKSFKPGLNSIILIPVKMINLLLKIYLTLIRLGFFRVVFPGGEGQFDPLPPLHISRRTYILSNFIQLLNNPFKICWKWKNADIIWYRQRISSYLLNDFKLTPPAVLGSRKWHPELIFEGKK